MAVQPGDHRFGPPESRIVLRTYRQGIAARAGHDLVLLATEWQGRATVPAQPGSEPSVDLEVDLRKLEVVEGTGGVKPLTDSDRQEILKQLGKTLRTDDHPSVTFRSSSIQVDGERAVVEGDLALNGQSHPLRFEVVQEGAAVTGKTEVVQSQWGIKPYSGFLGALKLRDAVGVEVMAVLPRA